MTKENWPSDLFVLAAEIISNSPWSNLLHSQQALWTYRGLVPFNFQRLENNLKPFELLIEPSSDETSLSMTLIIKCDQNKSLNVTEKVKSIRHLWFDSNVFRERTGESIRAMHAQKLARSAAPTWPSRGFHAAKCIIAAYLQETNEGGKFLKKLWCCVGGSITR